MKKLIRIAALAGAVALVAAGCVLPGTGTISVRNNLDGDQQVTALYIYPTGSPDTESEISSPLDHGDRHCELGVAPGAWTVEAIIDSGADSEVHNLTIVEGTLYPVVIGGIL